MTLLAVALTSRTTEQALADLHCAVTEFGADAVEFRLDHMANVDISRLMASVPPGVVVIATARAPTEGGVGKMSHWQRFEALVQAAACYPDYLDVELVTWQGYATCRQRLHPLLNGPPGRPRQVRSCQLILSFHDFEDKPEDVWAQVAAIEAEPARVLKIVWKAKTIVDTFECFELMRSPKLSRPIIAIVMGEQGLASRILAKKFGAFLSFCSIRPLAASAPGQITLADMKQMYRWDSITSNTDVYGVIGCPIAHSMSPAIHNAAMAETDIDGVYVPFRVEHGYPNFAAFVGGLMDRAWMDIRGLSVTIPHKENALRFVRERMRSDEAIEPLARQIGAVNTLVFDGPDVVRGLNTDYAGALDALTHAMGCERADLAGMPVAVLGAGGASRALVAGLRDCGCPVTICNRTFSRAEALAQEFDCRACPLDEASSLEAKIVVNTTSVGMHPNVNDTPLPADALRAEMVVFDTVYNPIETRLLREAREVGCRTVSGVDMFVQQAVAQFEAWTGRGAPVELMRAVVVQRLSQPD